MKASDFQCDLTEERHTHGEDLKEKCTGFELAFLSLESRYSYLDSGVVVSPQGVEARVLRRTMISLNQEQVIFYGGKEAAQ